MEEGVVANKNSNLGNDGIGWHIQKEQDEQSLLANNQPFSANCLCSDGSCSKWSIKMLISPRQLALTG